MPQQSPPYQGRLIQWDDEKGFGFIQPEHEKDQVFLHISQVQPATRRPKLNDTLLYQLTFNKKGQPQATQAILQGVPSKLLWLNPWHWGLILFCTFGALHLIIKTTPQWFPLNILPLFLYLLMSLIAYILYARDKYSALKSQWRIPENTLHAVEALGGWPGALIAQFSFRHKSAKLPYQILFWTIVTSHLIAWLLWFWSQL